VWSDGRHRYATFKSYFWWDVVLHNRLYSDTLARVLGRDRMGVVRFWEKLAPKLLRPVEAVAEMVDALEALMLQVPPAPSLNPKP
jgi:hypothetical protein